MLLYNYGGLYVEELQTVDDGVGLEQECGVRDGPWKINKGVKQEGVVDL